MCREKMRDVPYWVGASLVVVGLAGIFGGAHALNAGENSAICIVIPSITSLLLGGYMTWAKSRIKI